MALHAHVLLHLDRVLCLEQATSLAPAATAILSNPPLAESIADSPFVDYLRSDPDRAAVAALVGSPVVNEVLNNPSVIAALSEDPS